MIEGLSMNQISEQMIRSKDTIKARLTTATEKIGTTYEYLEAKREERRDG